MPQLRCRDLEAGDIMLKVNTGPNISLGSYLETVQKAFSVPFPQVMHAGIMFDSHYIIEAQVSGISGNDLRTGNRDVAYAVFRCANRAAGKGAATCAKMFFDIQKRSYSKTWPGKKHSTGNLPYALGKAHMSVVGAGGGTAQTPEEIHQLFDDVLGSRGRSFFCSQFVVFVYQFVAQQSGLGTGYFFNQSAAKMPPGTLYSTLRSNTRFNAVGVMYPGQR